MAPRRAITSACESWSASPRRGRRPAGRHLAPAPRERSRVRRMRGSCSAKLASTVYLPGCGAKGSGAYCERVADTTSSIAIAVVVPSESVLVGLDGHVVTMSLSGACCRAAAREVSGGFGGFRSPTSKTEKETRRSLIGGNMNMTKPNLCPVPAKTLRSSSETLSEHI